MEEFEGINDKLNATVSHIVQDNRERSKAADLIKNMTLPEVMALGDVCLSRQIELRESGMQALAQQFEAMSRAQLGMSAGELLAKSSRNQSKAGKRGRGRPRLVANGGGTIIEN